MIESNEPMTTRVLRRALLALFLFGAVGCGAELVLLDHTEGVWQWIPLALLGTSLVVLAWHRISPRPTTVRVFQVVMILFAVGGLIGLYQHYQGNAEFELEMYPSLGGLELIWESLRGATPALAPGMMIQLGLIGLAYAYRHPALILKTQPLNDTDK